MSMQYPILFPFGEDGYRIDIKYKDCLHKRSTIRQCATMRKFYAYRLQQKMNEGRTLIREDKLL